MTTKTKIRNSIAALAVSVTALAGFAPIAQAATPAPTKVLIEAESGGFFGYVKSPKLECKSERKVVLYKQLGQKQAPRTDKRVASDIAQANGDGYQWNTGSTGVHNGKVYARAPRIDGCKADNSKTLQAS